MRNVIYAVTIVIIGLLFGLIGWLTTLLVQWLFSLLPTVAIAEMTILGVALPTLISLLIVGLLAFIFFWFIVSSMNERPLAQSRTETLREVRKVAEDMTLLHPILAAEDGRHVFIALHIEDPDWNPSHPFYSKSVMLSTPGVWQTGMYYYLVLRRDANRITPIAMPQGYGSELEIEVLMRTTGLDFANIAFWRGLHKLLSEAGIPYVTPAVTAICVFFIAWGSKRLENQFKHYTQRILFPMIGQQGTPSAESPPKGLGFDAIECRFRIPDGPLLSFRRDIRQVPIDQLKATVAALEEAFYPFTHQHKARLLLLLANL